MKRLVEQTLYEILEVPPDASTEAIAAAVERARMLYGPGSLATYTLMTPDESALLARRIDEARETLLDPELRPLYDEEIGRERATPQNGAAAHVAPVKPLPPWPPPPVIPAVRAAPPPPPEAEDEDVEVDGEDELDDAGDLAPAAPVRAAAEEAPVAAPAPEAPPPPPPPARPAPILLDREVAAVPPPAPGPATTPAPGPATTPGPAMTPVPGAPATTAVPMLPPPPPAPVVPDQTLWTGEVLRQIREARGISLSQLSERTKVTRHHIENIEGDRYGLLPAPVYLRGILMSLARELRLDGQKVARSYLERFTGGAAPPPPARGR